MQKVVAILEGEFESVEAAQIAVSKVMRFAKAQSLKVESISNNPHLMTATEIRSRIDQKVVEGSGVFDGSNDALEPQGAEVENSEDEELRRKNDEIMNSMNTSIEDPQAEVNAIGEEPRFEHRAIGERQNNDHDAEEAMMRDSA